jgi:hypothetical protein
MPLNETVHPQADFMKTVVSDIKALYPPGVLHTRVTDSRADLGKDAAMDSLSVACQGDGLMIVMHREVADPWLSPCLKTGKLTLTTCGRVVGPMQPMGQFVVLFMRQGFYTGMKAWVLDTCRLMLDLHQVQKAGLEPVRFSSMLNRGEP